jgi:ABC-type dipeptide/oligopeptide/nickel transport system permease subunit
MLSHVVMSVVQVFLSLVMLSLAYVFVRDGIPSIEMWFDHGEDRCYDLSVVGMVGMVGFRQVMRLLMLESGKDGILGVDTPGQHVLARVWYGTACLLFRYAIGCGSCLVEWDGSCLCDQSLWHSVWTAWTTWCKRGHCVWETSILQARPCVGIPLQSMT